MNWLPPLGDRAERLVPKLWCVSSLEHETRFELASGRTLRCFASSGTPTRRSLIARASPFRWHALNRKGPNPKLTSSPRHKKGPPLFEGQTFSVCGARDQIRTGIPFEVSDLSYSLLANRSQLPLPLAMLLIERLQPKNQTQALDTKKARPASQDKLFLCMEHETRFELATLTLATCCDR